MNQPTWPVYIKNKFKNLWVVWAMWAIKNFVCGPSASVTFSRRPYPGASRQKQSAIQPRSQEPYRTLQCSTLVGGNVGIVHMTRWLAGQGAFWPCNTLVGGMWTMWTPHFQSLAKPWGVRKCEKAWAPQPTV